MMEEKTIEIKIESPCVLENSPSCGNEAEEADAEQVNFVYTAPRMFRRSLFHKTFKLFGPSEETDDKEKCHRSITENLWWLTIMLIGFLLSFSITDQAWQKFQRNPTFTSLILNQNDNKMVYPTVSICPKAAFDEDKVLGFIQSAGKGLNGTEEIQEFLKALPNFSYGSSGLKSVVLSETGKNFINQMLIDDVRNLAFKLAKPCGSVLEDRKCEFKNRLIDCCEAFLPVFTERGFCYAFNSRDFETEDNYGTINRNLFVVDELDFTRKLQFEVKTPAKIFINSVEDSLTYEQVPIEVQGGYTHEILLSLQQTQCDKDMRTLTHKQRKCLFPGEKKFKYFRNEIYTYSGCLKDCRFENAIDLCGCHPPFYNPLNSENITSCDFESLKCLKDEKILDLRKCRKCELACDFSVFTLEKIDSVRTFESNFTTGIVIDFKNYPLIYHREVRFGFIDFLVAFGSILALFLGFSLLSVIELIFSTLHFITSRMCLKHEVQPNLTKYYELIMTFKRIGTTFTGGDMTTTHTAIEDTFAN